MKKANIKRVQQLLASLKRSGRSNDVSAKAAVLALILGYGWVEQAEAANLTPEQLVQKLGAKLSAAQQTSLVADIKQVMAAGPEVSTAAADALAAKLTPLAMEAGISEKELVGMLKDVGLTDVQIAKIRPELEEEFTQARMNTMGEVKAADATAAGEAATAPAEGLVGVAAAGGVAPVLGGLGLAGVAAAGGGGGGAAVASTSSPTVLAKSLTLIDGPLSGANVFYDTNKNGVADAGEFLGKTNANGTFSFNYTPVAGAKFIFVPDENTVDTLTGNKFTTILMANDNGQAGTQVGSPISTLIASGAISETALKALLGLDASVNLETLNFTEALKNGGGGDAKILAAAQKLSAAAVAFGNIIESAINAAKMLAGDGATLDINALTTKAFKTAAEVLAKAEPGMSLGDITGVVTKFAAAAVLDPTFDADAAINAISGPINASTVVELPEQFKTLINNLSSTLATTSDNLETLFSNITDSTSFNNVLGSGGALDKLEDNVTDSTQQEVGKQENNHAPVTQADTVTGTEDTTQTISVANLLLNDSDADSDTLSFGSITGASNGTATFNAETGLITFVPNANYNGPAVINYTVLDGRGGVTSSQLTVNVTPVNDAPVAGPVTTIVGTEDVSQIISAATLLAGATDVDGNTLSIGGITSATNGTAIYNPTTGELTFTPTPNFHGVATINYTISDGQGGTVASSVNINVGSVIDESLTETQAHNLIDQNFSFEAGDNVSLFVDGTTLSDKGLTLAGLQALGVDAVFGADTVVGGVHSGDINVSLGSASLAQAANFNTTFQTTGEVVLGLTPAAVDFSAQSVLTNLHDHGIDALALQNGGTLSIDEAAAQHVLDSQLHFSDDFVTFDNGAELTTHTEVVLTVDGTTLSDKGLTLAGLQALGVDVVFGADTVAGGAHSGDINVALGSASLAQAANFNTTFQTTGEVVLGLTQAAVDLSAQSVLANLHNHGIDALALQDGGTLNIDEAAAQHVLDSKLHFSDDFVTFASGAEQTTHTDVVLNVHGTHLTDSPLTLKSLALLGVDQIHTDSPDGKIVVDVGTLNVSDFNGKHIPHVDSDKAILLADDDFFDSFNGNKAAAAKFLADVGASNVEVKIGATGSHDLDIVLGKLEVLNDGTTPLTSLNATQLVDALKGGGGLIFDTQNALTEADGTPDRLQALANDGLLHAETDKTLAQLGNLDNASAASEVNTQGIANVQMTVKAGLDFSGDDASDKAAIDNLLAKFDDNKDGSIAGSGEKLFADNAKVTLAVNTDHLALTSHELQDLINLGVDSLVNHDGHTVDLIGKLGSDHSDIFDPKA